MGYVEPKPLICINGREMIRIVIENLRPTRDHKFIFVCQQEHIQEYDLFSKLNAWAPGCCVLATNGLTQGAACTIMKARCLIDSETPLMIANSDQYIEFDIDDYLSRVDDADLDGMIVTMTASDAKWGYVALSDQGLVTKVAEKKVISSEATVGVYNFKRGRDFLVATDEMIRRDLRVNGEFYVAPAYNLLVEFGLRVGVYNVGSEANGMYGLGTPSDLELFLTLPVLERATAF